MKAEALFGLSVVMNFIAFGIVTGLYILPRLREMPREAALVALVVPHTFRFVGLTFLIPGVVSPALPPAFAAPAAYGDLVAAILAVVTIFALRVRAPAAMVITWVFNIWGAADLVNAIYQGGIGVGVGPGSLGAAYYIPTLFVPPWLVTHGLIAWLLVRPKQA